MKKEENILVKPSASVGKKGLDKHFIRCDNVASMGHVAQRDLFYRPCGTFVKSFFATRKKWRFVSLQPVEGERVMPFGRAPNGGRTARGTLFDLVGRKSL